MQLCIARCISARTQPALAVGPIKGIGAGAGVSSASCPPARSTPSLARTGLSGAGEPPRGTSRQRQLKYQGRGSGQKTVPALPSAPAAPAASPCGAAAPTSCTRRWRSVGSGRLPRPAEPCAAPPRQQASPCRGVARPRDGGQLGAWHRRCTSNRCGTAHATGRQPAGQPERGFSMASAH